MYDSAVRCVVSLALDEEHSHLRYLQQVNAKRGWQAYTTPAVRGICTFAVFFSVSRPFCSFTLVYEGHFVLCYKEKIELLDRVMANFERSQVCLISAVICMSLRWVWHLYNFPCVVYCFGSFPLQDIFFKSPRICFWGTKYDVYRESVVYLIALYIVTPGVFIRVD